MKTAEKEFIDILQDLYCKFHADIVDNMKTKFRLALSEAFKEGKEEGKEESIIARCYIVMHPDGDDWEQLSIAFDTLKKAITYFNSVNREKYPYPRIMIEIKDELISKL